MAHFVQAEDVAQAWLQASRALLDSRNGRMSNLCVAIAAPTVDHAAVRDEFRAFRAECSATGRKAPHDVDTVARTIFPNEFYRTTASNPEAHLYELAEITRSAVRYHPKNSQGTYFERLVAYPSPSGDKETINQLAVVLKRLRHASKHGDQHGNKYELALFHPARDTGLQGFPCLSSVSLTLSGGTLSATALYRNQYFIDRAYGNFLGLGNLLAFLCAESGFECGELVCLASHARIEIHEFGKTKLTGLLDNCTIALEKRGLES